MLEWRYGHTIERPVKRAGFSPTSSCEVSLAIFFGFFGDLKAGQTHYIICLHGEGFLVCGWQTLDRHWVIGVIFSSFTEFPLQQSGAHGGAKLAR